MQSLQSVNHHPGSGTIFRVAASPVRGIRSRVRAFCHVSLGSKFTQIQEPNQFF